MGVGEGSYIYTYNMKFPADVENITRYVVRIVFIEKWQKKKHSCIRAALYPRPCIFIRYLLFHFRGIPE